MPTSATRPPRGRRRSNRDRAPTRSVMAILGVFVTLLMTTALVSGAIAKVFSLSVAKHATVKDASTGKTTHEAVAVNAKGFVVYTLTGDSKTHPECTKANGCFKFWPPVTVASAKHASKAPGISGKLGVWKHNGINQLTLGGHPLYTFGPDTKKHVATGEGIVGFGGTWHVRKP